MFFLNENVNTEVQEILPLAEANLLLAENFEDQAVLTESLLRADYVISKEAQVLTEAGDEKGAEEKKKGFFSRAWESVVNFAKKVWARITTYYNSTVDFVKRKFARLRASGSVMVSKNVLEALPKMANSLIAMAKKVGTDGFDSELKDYQRFKADKLDNKKNTGEKIAVKDFNKFEGLGMKVNQDCRKESAKLQAEIKAVESSKGQDQEKLKTLRKTADHVSKLASAVGSFNAALARVGGNVQVNSKEK